ncbi:hypothetical protein HMPREF1487_04370 [Pseudomonas sp. HPB0071]|uniref:YdaU family protein n=1 Tax=unclassified Pseudomonas TaxID=196821 RepID=UPI0002C90F78|nr:MULTISPECIES: YdaU family protein [unclassified Pseudomonas]ENA37452.1 hypothetical protein HMPREF1487_04370 [Pseudomonas sp. HPB0071]
MNFFPFHPGDYMLRTAHLNVVEDAAYRRLIDLYYVNESPIEGNAESIARVIRMREHAIEVAAVLAEFFEATEEGFRHHHCDKVIAQYHAKAKQAAENGKRGGRPKKQDESKPDSEPKLEETETVSGNNPEKTQPVNSANPEETGSKANQEPLTNNQEPKEEPPLPPEGECGDQVEAAEDLFSRFWKLYPRKTDKAKAQKAWAKLNPDQPLFEEIMAGLGRCCVCRDWTKDEGQYIPHPTTWLNGRRWEDEVKPASNVHHLPNSRHTGFAERDYTQGLYEREDGTHGF